MPKPSPGRQSKMVRKKKAEIQSRQVSGEQPAVAPIQMKAGEIQTALTSTSRTTKATSAFQPLNITIELKRIGILTAIIIIVLVVLAIILT